ncbi:hypothetical protein [Paremcibacter congregatus]|uniref:hypothetical protein n=1 Tax=Paremcibacter congregatus TaxID=2043170 RepID=UPI003A935A24
MSRLQHTPPPEAEEARTSILTQLVAKYHRALMRYFWASTQDHGRWPILIPRPRLIRLGMDTSSTRLRLREAERRAVSCQSSKYGRGQ